MLKIFKQQTKFAKGAVKRTLKFAWTPTYIDGGVHRIWLSFFYRVYVQKETYMNWDMPDKFDCVGDYSSEGANRKLNSLIKYDPKGNYHWANEDQNYFPSYLS